MLLIDHHEGTKDTKRNPDGGDWQMICLKGHHSTSHRLRGSQQQRLLVIDFSPVSNHQDRYPIMDRID